LQFAIVFGGRRGGRHQCGCQSRKAADTEQERQTAQAADTAADGGGKLFSGQQIRSHI